MGIFPIGESYVLNPVGEGRLIGGIERLYVGTTDLGVYRSIDSSLWEAVNTNIQSLNVVDMAGSGSTNVVALTGLSGNRAVNVLFNETWTVALTDAQARTLTGVADVAATLIDVEKDVVTGYIYAIFTRLDIAQTTVPLYVLRSIDNGNNWTAAIVENSLYRYREIGNLAVYDSHVTFGMGFNIPARSRIFISNDYGLNWAETVSLGSLFTPFTFINPYDATFIYARGNAGADLIRVNYDTTTSTIQAGFAPIRSDAMTFESANDQYIFIQSINELKTTANAWSTFSTVAVINDGGVFYSDPTLYFGDISPLPSTVLKDTALNNASGPNPGTPPYTDSIPETSGGVCVRRAMVAA